MADQTEREQVRKDAIKLLKERLAEGRIKSMDLKILMELLKEDEEEEGFVKEGKPMASLLKDLPFEGENVTVGNFPVKRTAK